MHLSASVESRGEMIWQDSAWRNLCQNQSTENFNERREFMTLCESIAAQFDIRETRIPLLMPNHPDQKVNFGSWISLFLTIMTMSGCPCREKSLFLFI
jgi:hypothetical protein